MLKKYLDILHVGGKIYVTLPAHFIEINGELFGLDDYLNSIKGASVSWLNRNYNYEEGRHDAFVITKDDINATVKQLASTGFKKNFPPERKYNTLTDYL